MLTMTTSLGSEWQHDIRRAHDVVHNVTSVDNPRSVNGVDLQGADLFGLSGGTTPILPYVIGGAVLIGLIYLFMRRK